MDPPEGLPPPEGGQAPAAGNAPPARSAGGGGGGKRDAAISANIHFALLDLASKYPLETHTRRHVTSPCVTSRARV